MYPAAHYQSALQILWIYKFLTQTMLRVRAIFIPIWNRKITRNERTLNWFLIDSQMVVFDAFTEYAKEHARREQELERKGAEESEAKRKEHSEYKNSDKKKQELDEF